MTQNQSSYMPIMKDLAGYLTPNQMLMIYRACDKWRDKILVRLLWKSGRRISEILQIKVKDIDFNDMRILWNIIKKKKPYRAWKPIDSKTIQLLGWYVQETGLEHDHYILHAGYPHKPISRQRAFQIIRRVGKRAGITHVGEKKIHPHHFRHSFSVDMAKRLKTPADMEKLRRLLEHNHLGMTQTYLQFSDQDLRDLIEE